MGKCTYLDQCPMFRQFYTSEARRVYVMIYCEGDFERCARKKKRDAGEAVPEKLLPNGSFLP